MSSIEINGTFYSLQRSASYAKWRAETPDDFVFAVKCPRFITHILRLKDAEIALANFLASGVLRLGPKLGPLLWQLPPSLPFDAERLVAFFNLLPRTTRAAAVLGRRHDDHVRYGAWLETDDDRPLRHALEVRHPSFKTPAFIALLRKHHIALVVADTAGKWPALEDVTTDFVYVRLHGQSKLYVSGYTPAALDSWAQKIRAWARGRSLPGPHRIAPPGRPTRGRDVYVYFDNDVKTHAPFDAISLGRRLGIEPAVPSGLHPDPSAEEPRTEWPEIGSPRPVRRRS